MNFFHAALPTWQKRGRIITLHCRAYQEPLQYLDQLGWSEEAVEVTSKGTTYRLSAQQQLLRATQQKG